MQLRFTRIDQTLPAPTYATPGSVAFDVAARVDAIVAARSIGRIPSNLIMQVPEGYTLLLCSRSSTPAKLGLHIPHGIGIVDQDFRGPGDEMLVQVYNATDADVVVRRGDKIAQAMIVPVLKVELQETALATAESRGGFGNTDAMDSR